MNMTEAAQKRQHENSAPAQVRREFATVNGVRLSYLIAGEGRPVVLVHGSVTTSELFRETLEVLGRSHLVIAPDLRGYGNSDKPKTGYCIEQFAADIHALLKQLQLEDVLLLGVSMGGFVVQRVALRAPDRLSALVLASTSDGEVDEGAHLDALLANLPSTGWRAASEDMIRGAFSGTGKAALMQPLLDRIETWNEDVLVGVLHTISEFSTAEELQSISVPTLVVVGSEDKQLPVALSQRLAQNVPGAKLEVFEGAGHFVMLEQPVKFQRVLSDFLEETSHGRSRSVAAASELASDEQVRQLKTLLDTNVARVTHTILDAGQEIPWHFHSKVDDVFYVLEGSILIDQKPPSQPVRLEPGQTHRVKSGEPHRVRNGGTSSAGFILIQGIGPYDFKHT